jgi:predicted O-methyltransferase YrrM
VSRASNIAEARFVLSLRRLPLRVALFMFRARRHALRAGDEFTAVSAIRPDELAALLRLARGRRAVTELGTGTAVSAIALALADGRRKVVTCDPCVRPERDAYLALAGSSARGRIELRAQPDSDGPRPGDAVELLFVDSEHVRESVLNAFWAWRDCLVAGAVVAFHDYDHPSYPGVREAVSELGLEGRSAGGMFIASIGPAKPGDPRL